MKSILAALLLAGCMAGVTTEIPVEYARCEEYRAWEPDFCSAYYVWVPPSYTVRGYWEPGRWQPRPGYRRPIVHDHRR